MNIVIALVIGDASPEGIYTIAAISLETLRRDLIAFHNQAVVDGGLDDEAFELDADTRLEELPTWIGSHLGRTLVILEDVKVLPPS